MSLLVVTKNCDFTVAFWLGREFKIFLKLEQGFEGYLNKHNLDFFAHRDLNLKNFAQKHSEHLLSKVADYHAAIFSRYASELHDDDLGFSKQPPRVLLGCEYALDRLMHRLYQTDREFFRGINLKGG